MSFLIFLILDVIFAYISTDFRKTRAYWVLCLFVDGPAVIAFVILLLYLTIAPTPSTDIMSGAVVMQMLVADTLYLFVASNVPLWFLANHLSKGCDQ